MRKILNTIVLFIYKKCCKYIETYIYMPKHADKEFWDESDFT